MPVARLRAQHVDTNSQQFRKKPKRFSLYQKGDFAPFKDFFFSTPYGECKVDFFDTAAEKDDVDVTHLFANFFHFDSRSHTFTECN